MAATPGCNTLRLALLPALLAAALAPHAYAAPAADDVDTVVITGKRIDEPGTTTALTADDLTRRGATDMQNMARYAPLVSVPGAASGSGNVWDGAGNTGFNIRGVEGNRVSLDLDGIALPDAAPKPDGMTANAFGVGRDYFDPETFRTVEISSGTTATRAGTPGLGGAVTFVTKAPEDYVSATHPVHADYKFGYDGAANMRMHALTGAVHSGAWEALALLVHRDGSALESSGSVAVNPDDWNSDALLAKLAYSPRQGHTLVATIDAYRAQHRRRFDNKQGASYPEGAAQDSRTRRSRASIDHRFTGTTPWFDTLESRIYVQDAEVADATHARYITGNQPYVRDIATGFENDSVGVTTNATKRFGAHGLAYGFSAESIETRRPWREDRTVIATGAHQIMSKNRMADTDTRKLAAYARGELALGDFTITPGLRYDHRELKPKNLSTYAVAVPGAAGEVREESDGYFTPSLALAYALRPEWSAYLQYSRGTRLPTAAERTGTYDSFSYTGGSNGYAVLGNAGLKKETSNAFELGIKGQVARGVRVSAALFHTSYDNLIEYAAQPPDPVNYPTITFGLYRPENVGDAKTWGGEASARFDFGQWSAPLNGTSLALVAGVQHSKARNEASGMEAELASTLPRKASATLAWDDPGKRGGASVSLVHVGAKRADADVFAAASAAVGTRFAVPSYTIMDLAAYWNVGGNAELTAGIYNVTDKKYWDYANSRSLPAGTTAATLADIERQARPGRYAAVTFKLIY
ncbi:TonB-dependent receptor domain-containing protein [Pseudoduganella plicata]|uniref:TonB-dependent receptor n=1 Tax=Pseudoduganella plicata TaxID=321984 RepID=A0A4P7BCR3_9BURK|nr:TonB-dependent receptor [Pseudoduganella plicata]QBQ36324.1 TonB-dependent receptor [Pseudoduganella plicata]GGY76087.1 TonB-dependent receptor [Pseudoduganella plicata]